MEEKYVDGATAELLHSTYKSQSKLLETVLFRFLLEFQEAFSRICAHEARAFEYIHQIDNHLDQMRICQKVTICELPNNLDSRVKDRLLTKIYSKIFIIIYFIIEFVCYLK